MQMLPRPDRAAPTRPGRPASAARPPSWTSAGQMLDGGDAAEAVAELLQQCEPVGAQLRVVGIDHHAVEERIHLWAQARQACEHGDLVMAVERIAGVADGRFHRFGQRFLGRLAQQAGVDIAGDLPFDLAQDIADALVRRSQRIGFGQRGEDADGIDAAVEVVEEPGSRPGALLRWSVSARPRT